MELRANKRGGQYIPRFVSLDPWPSAWTSTCRPWSSGIVIVAFVRSCAWLLCSERELEFERGRTEAGGFKLPTLKVGGLSDYAIGRRDRHSPSQRPHSNLEPSCAHLKAPLQSHLSASDLYFPPWSTTSNARNAAILSGLNEPPWQHWGWGLRSVFGSRTTWWSTTNKHLTRQLVLFFLRALFTKPRANPYNYLPRLWKIAIRLVFAGHRRPFTYSPP